LLEQALAVARSQNARSIEFLVARDIADLLSQKGVRTRARDLLASIYGWFTEGFETARSEEDEGSSGRVLLSRILTDIQAQGVSQTCNGLFA